MRAFLQWREWDRFRLFFHGKAHRRGKKSVAVLAQGNGPVDILTRWSCAIGPVTPPLPSDDTASTAFVS
jgi:hypothetical protein